MVSKAPADWQAETTWTRFLRPALSWSRLETSVACGCSEMGVAPADGVEARLPINPGSAQSTAPAVIAEPPKLTPPAIRLTRTRKRTARADQNLNPTCISSNTCAHSPSTQCMIAGFGELDSPDCGNPSLTGAALYEQVMDDSTVQVNPDPFETIESLARTVAHLALQLTISQIQLRAMGSAIEEAGVVGG